MFDILAPHLKGLTEDLNDEIKYQKFKHGIKEVKEFLEKLANRGKVDPLSSNFAQYLDENDKLKYLRYEFSIPKSRDIVTDKVEALSPEEECMYFCGNSLGLMPKRARELISQELDVWASSGVVGHFKHKHNRPWVSIEDTVVEKMADIVAKPIEIAIMNTLTSNLHLLMASFYTPNTKKTHPAKELIKVTPPEGESVVPLNSILEIIEKEGHTISLVLFSGVHYYTGQFFKMKKITQAAQRKGCIVGFDLSHAVGNVVLKLHKWGIDFAAWCSYKYLNSGPGGIAGIFLHEKHANDFNRPRLAGWWGSERKSRFKMDQQFKPIPGASGFQVSNPSVLNVVSLLASLELFSRTSMVNLRAKSILLTGYLEYLLDKQLNGLGFKIITPRDPHQRGCQLSLKFFERSVQEKVHKELMSYGAVVDERSPDIIRIAPNPMYNNFSEVFRFVRALKVVIGDIGVKD
ncbi:1271_t:CDS:2 [Funneliformis mosseae]|uniref:Kynureninase n=1 Tax=Funneliformis mosseae TaxID=27381 RepID=A0A9N9A5E9_FUNMO|nr:1271_t:CDS:2 [Funneliformis mosseae]